MCVLHLVTHPLRKPFSRTQLEVVAMVETVEVVKFVSLVRKVFCPMSYYLYSRKLVDECKPMSKQILCFVL